MMKLFCRNIELYPLTIFAKNSIIGVWQGSKYVSTVPSKTSGMSNCKVSEGNCENFEWSSN